MKVSFVQKIRPFSPYYDSIQWETVLVLQKNLPLKGLISNYPPSPKPCYAIKFPFDILEGAEENGSQYADHMLGDATWYELQIMGS